MYIHRFLLAYRLGGFFCLGSTQGHHLQDVFPGSCTERNRCSLNKPVVLVINHTDSSSFCLHAAWNHDTVKLGTVSPAQRNKVACWMVMPTCTNHRPDNMQSTRTHLQGLKAGYLPCGESNVQQLHHIVPCNIAAQTQHDKHPSCCHVALQQLHHMVPVQLAAL